MNARIAAVRGDDNSRKGRRDHAGGGSSTGEGQGGAAVRVLVVGTDDWAIEQAVTDLEAGGCQVLRCHEPGQPAFPCNALVEGRTCPLDVGFDVVADMRARTSGGLTQSEFGVVCALHHGKSLVLAGIAPDVPLGPWAARTVAHGGSLVEACEAVATENKSASAEPVARGVS